MPEVFGLNEVSLRKKYGTILLKYLEAGFSNGVRKLLSKL